MPRLSHVEVKELLAIIERAATRDIPMEVPDEGDGVLTKRPLEPEEKEFLGLKFLGMEPGKTVFRFRYDKK